MKLATTLAYLSLTFSCSSITFAVTFEWATVGNPGNPDNVFFAGYGGVDYTYRISKHEVTNAQYVDFLNAVAADDPNGLFNTDMEDYSYGGIIREGSPGSYSYSVKPNPVDFNYDTGEIEEIDYPYASKPVVYVSFLDVMRFVNWLENGQPSGAQDTTTTEDGTYTIDSGYFEIRNPNSEYFVPNYDEWQKAAFHKNDGVTGNYWEYPASSDIPPDNSEPSVDSGNSANYDVATGDPLLPLTDVGAYTLSVSAYGTYDQGGNVTEWTETPDIDGFGFRYALGGNWNSSSSSFMHANRPPSATRVTPDVESIALGFRVANKIIPEPTTCGLAMIATLCLVVGGCRRRVSRLML